jgi:hypothetical protein
LGATCRGSVREEEVREVLGEDVGGRSSKRVRMVHRHLVVDADENDVARGNGLEVDLVVGDHHAEGLLDAQVKGTAQALGNMPAEGAKATRHRAPGLHIDLFDPLARLEGGGPQLLQLLLRGVVGHLEGLYQGRRVPKSVPRAWKPRTKN